ncbi:MAG: sulfite exporter TauE/SafE family protein [Rhodospirillaceae bacterium]|nr:sulfite exporter TauE/SafE family protein [Rhodospirillaceae bacterium]
MSPEIAILLTGAFLAAFATGAAGFGDALIAISIWLYVLSPQEAVPLIVACGAVMSIYSLWKLGRQLDYSKLPAFALAGAVGVPVGAWILKFIEPDLFRMITGGFLVTYAGVFLLARSLPHITAGGRIADSGVGFAGGIMGGFAGLSGVLPTVWCGLRGWPKATQRGTFQPFLAIMHILALISLAFGGLVTMETAERFLWCLPALLLGVWLGLKIYRHLDEILFRRVVLGILLVSGIALLISTGGTTDG